MKQLPIIITLLAWPFFTMCQPPAISGKVVNEDGQPVPHATITNNSTHKTVTAGSDGSFTIPHSPFATYDARVTDTLIIAAPGFLPQTIHVSPGAAYRITLLKDTGVADPLPFYSEFAACDPSLPSAIVDTVSDDGRYHSLIMINIPLVPMLVRASGLSCRFPASQTVLRVKDTSRFLPGKAPAERWSKQNSYCFRAFIPSSVSAADRIGFMLSSLRELALVNASLVTGTVPSLVISNEQPVGSSGKAPVLPFLSGTISKPTPARSVGVLHYLLSSAYIGLPVFNETTLHHKPRLMLTPALLADLGALNTSLNATGIYLSVQNRQAQLLVISDTINHPSKHLL